MKSESRSSSPTIIQTGTYSSFNKGDAAMELSAARMLRRRFPGARILISTPFPHYDAQAYGEFEIMLCRRRRLIWATGQLMRIGLYAAARRVLKSDWRWLILEREIREMLGADLIVDLSGDMLTEDYGPHVAYSHYLPLLFALGLGRPLFLCAQSVGPFKWTLPLARFILHRAAAISLRDHISGDYLKKIGIDNPQLHQTADLAFLLEAASVQRVDEILDLERIETSGQHLLGVSLSRLVTSKFHGTNPGVDQSAFFQTLASVLDRTAEKHNLTVLFVPHVTGPSREKDDRQISRQVAARMNGSAHVIGGDYLPGELKGIIGRCEIFLGARMHANIAALSQEIPTVALAYSHKTPGIMDLFGQKNLVLDSRTAQIEELEATLSRVWQERETIRREIGRHLGAVKENAQRNLDLAEEILTRRTDPGSPEAETETR
jgi:colanic acid/amylovoran biosynthesis protein